MPPDSLVLEPAASSVPWRPVSNFACWSPVSLTATRCPSWS